MTNRYAGALAAYERFAFAAQGYTREVFMRGEGPAVVVMAEIPGIHPGVIAFADRLVAAGLSVYLPSLMGEPGRPVDPAYMRNSIFRALCVHREFTVWRLGRSSPIVDWLRALAREAHARRGGRGVGAVGMCFTGGFALAMMTEPSVVAPVLAQPSLPLALGAARAAAIDLSPGEMEVVRERMERENLCALGLRFEGDATSPKARMDALEAAFPGHFERIDLPDSSARPSSRKPHSTLTVHLADTGPTKDAEARVIAFLREATGAP